MLTITLGCFSMRFFITVIAALLFCVLPPTQAHAIDSIQAAGSAKTAGCNKINSILGKIPGAFKTIMLYEGVRFHFHKRGLKSEVKVEVKCNENELFKNLEETLNLLCSNTNGLAPGISGKLDSIKSNLTSISGAEKKIKNKADLGNFLDKKMVDIDNDRADIARMGPKVNTNPTNSNRGEGGWISFSKRKSCRSSNKKDGSSTTTPEEQAADNAASDLAKARREATEAQENYDTQKQITAIAKAKRDALIAQYGDFTICSGNSAKKWQCNQVSSARESYNKKKTKLDEFKSKLDKAKAAEKKAQTAFDAAMKKVAATPPE